MDNKICPYCGKQKHPQAKQCMDCYKNWIKNPKNHIFYGTKRTDFSKKIKGKNNPNYKGGPDKLICKVCGKTFFKYKSQRKNSEHAYCSRKCFDMGKRVYVDENVIYELYYNKKLSHSKIAVKLGCKRELVKNIFKRNNWKSRTVSESLFLLDKGIKLPDKTIIRLYKKHTADYIAKLFTCSNSVISKCLLKNKIKLRTTSESLKLTGALRGKNNPNWVGGISKLPYSFDFTQKLKDEIRKRDNYCCQICGKSEKKNRKKLSIHHIDYDKKNCDINNLICLCNKCHPKTNFNRDYWYAYCKEVIVNGLFI